MTVRIVSYNLLVPILANRPANYPKCQPQFLGTEHRWNLIQSDLKKEMVQHENTIICLQEISFTLIPELELFFRRLNYTFFHSLYGPRSLDYMGVGMAIPLSMQLNSISMIKIGDLIQSTIKRREQEVDLYESKMDDSLQVAYDPWPTAIAVPNTLICLQVVIDNKPLFIGTYHMPCFFKEPEVMAIHSSVLKDLMFQLAAGQNLILAGDFNIKPKENCYHALTEKGYVDINFPKSSTYEISYRPNTEQILKSAYREKNGTEPVYTNFCDTLDYIFFHGHLTVENVLELPAHPTSGSYPDATHPSDHLMIAATFRVL
jgi:mRNA deadenylase 3'-5' endonuclease subunit Ccr4